MLPNHRRPIEDAIQGKGGGVAVVQEMISPTNQKLDLQELIEARRLPREERKQFYRQWVEGIQLRIKTEVREVD